MGTYIFALCWAAAILLLAVAARSGAVDQDTAAFLLMVLPMIAFVTLLGRRDCQPCARKA